MWTSSTTRDTTAYTQCQLNLVAPFDAFDLAAPTIHFTTQAALPIANVATFVEIFNGFFNQFDTNAIPLQEIGCIEGCSTASLQFFIGEDPATLYPGTARLTIDNQNLFNQYAIPEPGTLGLLLGAFGAGWAARRRKSGA